ncbi:fatty acid hydroxylase [Gymnopus androsaceus JB14]|uniref:Fatty acid hydroxylase n=1 Tax=Gymnopus androsaceus JB14 TaxID=1447944 RepID=A0A6A4H6C1_9AGAR|nr:fatty acid hydroxylase [Gymnopus androsaceus JB14]
MDLVLDIADTYVFDAAYSKLLPLAALPIEAVGLNITSTTDTLSAWPRSYIPRQVLSLSILTLLGIHVLYFLFASLSYYLIFNHEMMLHPRFLPKQVSLEIRTSLEAFPVMTILTLPWFLGEVRGWSKLYDSVEDQWGGWWYLVASVPCFLLFTDYCIYWIHRWLHHPLLYKPLHKPHHKWIIPTPFASHAFHPVDGYLQSVPYHLFIFLFPMHRVLYLVMFVAVNFWSIFIHDSDMITGHPLENVINGPAHHTLHHLYFTVNYGQYFTWADRAGKSYRHPDASLDPLLEVQMRQRAERERKAKSD